MKGGGTGLLKHMRNWSHDVLEREVRANLVYRAFTRIGDETVPDAKTLARLGQLVGGKVIEQIYERVVELAQERAVTRGEKMWVDTTVVERRLIVNFPAFQKTFRVTGDCLFALAESVTVLDDRLSPPRTVRDIGSSRT